MSRLYFILDLLALSGPLLLSFDKRVRYFRSWPYVFIATLIVAIPFVIHDYFFTRSGYWGFNADYLIGITFINLPIEEILFFIIVPFACSFIYACANYYLRNKAYQKIDRVIQLAVLSYLAFFVLSGGEGKYTLSVIVSSTIVLLFWFWDKRAKHVGVSFVLSLIPFFLMNSVLTGSFIPSPIVWYNENEKVAGRIGTIPFEDLLYAFTMIVGVILIFERIKPRK